MSRPTKRDVYDARARESLGEGDTIERRMLDGEMVRLGIVLARLRAHFDALHLHLDDPRPFGSEVGQSLTAATGDLVALLARVDTLRRLVPPSPPPHPSPRDEPAVVTLPARGAVGDDEREPERGPAGDEVG